MTYPTDDQIAELLEAVLIDDLIELAGEVEAEMQQHAAVAV